MRKRLFLLSIISVFLTSCSSESNNDDNSNNLIGTDEYVFLIPYSNPLSAVEKSENEVILSYYDSSDNLYKICQINENGEIDWVSDLQINPVVWSGQLFIENNIIYFFHFSGDTLELTKLDLNGNLLNDDFIQNQEYNSLVLVKTENGFIATNYEIESIQYDEYSLSGNLLGSYLLDYSNSQSNLSSLKRKGDKSYLFRNYNLNNSSYYEDFDCNIFDSNGDLSSTISLTGLEQIGGIHSSFPITDDKILMVTRENGTVNLNTYNSFGNISSSENFDNFNDSFNLFPLSNNNICFLGERSVSDEDKKLSFKVLNSNLDVISERNIGSLDNIGTFNFKYSEGLNYQYIYGVTDSESGDFDLPNNTTTTDLFFFRLKK
ncbi:MAG: hypothetical protein L3J09_06310 [Flavobacteriaceae bacterium]|nr:hypothetical protein [Flavobacteriaceae bacterium]